MLYDGAITFLNRAVAAMEAHDIQKKCNHLNRALAIIAQLEGSLNFESGGEVARTLKSFYVYARTQALKANLQNSPEMLRALIGEFATVREAWYEADHRPPPSSTTPAGERYHGAPSPTPEPGSWSLTG
jgi:flagellar protein FliS